MLVLVACDPVLPPVEEVDAFQVISTTGPIAALQVRISYQPNSFDFRGVSGVAAGALVHTYDDENGSLTIGLVLNGADASGSLLTLNWSHDDEQNPPTFATIAAFDSSLAGVGNRLRLGALTTVAGASVSTVRSTVTTLNATSLPPDETAQAITTMSLTDELEASFADYPLGDLDKDGTVAVKDALMVRRIVGGGVETDAFMRYHADLDGDYLVQISDVAAALKKAVDPTVPASLIVKPTRLTYVDMVAGRPVLVGNGGSEELAGLVFESDNPRGDAFEGDVDEPLPGHSAVYTVADANDAFGWLRVSTMGSTSDVIVGNIVILVAGQSNASGQGKPAIPGLQNGSSWPEVRALTNDYRWLPAVEPLDSALNQSSFDPVSLDAEARVSPGVQAARLLNRGSGSLGIEATDRYVYLIPAALGGSSLAPDGAVGWYLGAEDLADTNRATLFGSAAYRGLVSAGLRDMPANAQPSEYDAEGGPVNAVFWYQGETDSRTTTRRGNFIAHTSAVFSGFENQLQTAAGEPAIIYAQLAPHGWDPSYPSGNPDTQDEAQAKDRVQMDIAERQRRMEEGAYEGAPYLSPQSGLGAPRANSHMVVTNDLPRSDRIHLSSDGQVKLAERIALAYQEHVLGMDVDGTGPRLLGMTRSGTTITVTFDRDVTNTAAAGPQGYAGFFTAWDGIPVPSNPESSTYGQNNQLTITDVRRHPDDPRAVRITLSSAPSGQVYVRYMRPFEPTVTSGYVEDVVRSQASGLPLPSFGPLRVN